MACCAGSGSVGVGGFAHLQGYDRQEHKFTLRQGDAGRIDKLPTPQTCFNTLILPPYAAKEELRQKLTQAVKEGGASGFDEGAVAV